MGLVSSSARPEKANTARGLTNARDHHRDGRRKRKNPDAFDGAPTASIIPRDFYPPRNVSAFLVRYNTSYNRGPYNIHS